ncbi:MAG: FliI/YscN family ATPase [Planctomycetota bacterium]|nr:MAG: FliI/YscN family ATPase [Planctomycetota bacterium]
MSVLEHEIQLVRTVEPLAITGSVVSVRGLTVRVRDLAAPVGAQVRIGGRGAGRLGEVVGFDGAETIVMPYGPTAGLRTGDGVRAEQCAPVLPVGEDRLGRVLDAMGRPIDDGPPLVGGAPMPLDPEPIAPTRRRRITEPLETGVRAIDALLTVGRGQRVGLFAGPGVGKSTLLGSIARNTAADVSVVALIGERGREVGDFLDTALGAEGLKRSVVIVATSDQSPLMRLRAMLAACATAEFFRDAGAAVTLLMDSITRLAQAQRQVGLAVGEPPATKGYPPSVFALLPRVLERAGRIRGAGSITGFYAVLVEGDEVTDPIADAVRGILDGHIALSRDLAQRGHFPAIDPLASVSRVADDVSGDQQIEARRRVLRALAAHREVEDLVRIGAYARGSSPEADLALEMKPRIDAFLQQGATERSSMQETIEGLFALTAQMGALERSLAGARGPDA